MEHFGRSYSSGSTSTPSTICIGRTGRANTNYSKIIKGEIHNLLNCIRADHRYASPNRFNSDFITNSDTEHPLISSLKELNEYFSKSSSSSSSSSLSSSASLIKTTTGTTTRTQQHDAPQHINSIRYLSPFCTAVSSRDVSAPITGAALSALYKFLLYGFIDPELVHDAKEGITIVARAIQHCSFEENESKANNNGRNYRTRSSSFQVNGGPISNVSQKRSYATRKTSTTNASMNISDEEVVLKLLSLASLVIRSPAGISLLHSSDIVGIFDTCLHVATSVGDKASTLLQSAATDCLGSIVLVVFGHVSSDNEGGKVSNGEVGKDTCKGLDDDDSDGSDDLWGDIDPILSQDKADTTTTNASLGVGGDNIIANAPPSPSFDKSQTQTEEIQERVTIPKGSAPAIVTIMSRLASLANPLANPDYTCVQALQLINIALETAPADHLTRHQELLDILSGTLCKHLLYLSTTPDLVILSLTLRVVFNLFNSIKNHLKVQLEVFLSSVHLRILDVAKGENGFSPEQREIALESLLEFCHEPELMMDLYMNYDCDVQSTNLFETICRVLASVATNGISFEDDGKLVRNEEQILPSSTVGDDSEDDESHEQLPLNILNKLAFEGILTVINSIATRCEHINHGNLSKYESGITDNACYDSPIKSDGDRSSCHSDSSDAESDSVSSLDGESGISSPISLTGFSHHPPLNMWLQMSPDQKKQSSKMLSQRKRQKHRIATTVVKFNKKPTGKEWLQFGESVGVIEAGSPQSVANFLYEAPNLDKSQIGIYLSKGPKEQYPFNSRVLTEFLSLFDIEDLEFSDALRLFLLKFRLPGEAQCIDRLMEAFAARLFEQQQHDIQKHKAQNQEKIDEQDLIQRREQTTKPSSPLEEQCVLRDDTFETDSTTLSTTDDTTEETSRRSSSLFRSADSIFILAFSTIMLNTDLHNPNMNDEKRMTIDQFIRNNRGINDGEDFPIDFMTTLYNQIKECEIQVQRDLSDVIGDGVNGGIHQSLDGLFSSTREPFFSSHDVARYSVEDDGIHERDMFTVIFDSAVKSLSVIFTQSVDDSLVTRSLEGLSQMATICAYLKLDKMLNRILEILVEFGREYIIHYLLQEQSDVDDDNIPIMNRLPRDEDKDCTNDLHEMDNDTIEGSAYHKGKGLLCLDHAFAIMKASPTSISEALPNLLRCIFFLRDIGGVPSMLAELDDFADSNGKILPPSLYAVTLKRRVKECISSMFQLDSTIEETNGVGFWPFTFSSRNRNQSDDHQSVEDEHNSFPFFNHAYTLRIASMMEMARIDQMIVGKKEKARARHLFISLLQFTDENTCDLSHCSPYNVLTDAGQACIYEHQAVYSLELAARLLFANRDYAVELFPLLTSRFEAVIKDATTETITNQDDVNHLSNPFLMERISVTILRSCIHLADRREIHHHLMKSLLLLFHLPPQFLLNISSRLGCGCAILLRSSYSQLQSPDEWKVLGDLIDLCAHAEQGRSFIFDGIASCVEDCFPDSKALDDKIDKDQAIITYDGASLFARFLLKITFGSFDGDHSLAMAAVSCLDKVYWYLYYLTVDSSDEDKEHHVIPDEELWCSVCSAFYSVSLIGHDDHVSLNALNHLERIVLATEVKGVTQDGWLSLLENLTTKQTDIQMERCRVKTFSLSCRILLLIAPEINESKEGLKSLKDIVGVMAVRAGENLRAGRKGSVSPLFESTVEILTNTLNVMSLTEFKSSDEFRDWITEILTTELAKVGAVGGLGNLHQTPFDMNQIIVGEQDDR